MVKFCGALKFREITEGDKLDLYKLECECKALKTVIKRYGRNRRLTVRVNACTQAMRQIEQRYDA